MLVLGDAGIGKSTLIRETASRLDGWQVLRAGGVEFESELPYSALHQLCAPVLDYRAGLPVPQRERARRGVRAARRCQADPDACRAGRPGPAECRRPAQAGVLRGRRRAVDRRRLAAGTGLRRGTRGGGAGRDGVRCPRRRLGVGARSPTRLTLTGLSDSGSPYPAAISGTLRPRGSDRATDPRRGEPAIRLPWWSSPATPDRSVCRRDAGHRAVEPRFARRFLRLPALTRSVLALAAAEPTGDLVLLRRAMAIQGLDAVDLTAAEESGLLVTGPRVYFRHPLARSAVYRSTGAGMRRQVHAALRRRYRRRRGSRPSRLAPGERDHRPG